jgi:maltooligosyltrehalose trehalohydrolase
LSEYPWERPLGATPLEDGRTEFRVWSPRAEPKLILGSSRKPSDVVPLDHVGFGIYEVVAEVPPGTDYRYLIGNRRLPDPASRWQPKGLRGPSRVYASSPPTAFTPKPLAEQVIYELHVGTFSAEGTFSGAIPYLAALAQLGVTAIELMPVAEFPGARGWGYDGVYLSAAQSSYGGPLGLQQLIDAAHDEGLAVILDVVYNHVGASGNTALDLFGPYFTKKYETFWGRALNYDDAECDPVREWVLQSAEGWIRDFGIDGLRLDAIHAIFDSSVEHIVEAVARRVHALGRRKFVIVESGLNDPRVMRSPARGGYGCDAAWADDFHHALRTLITDEHDGYYAEFGRVGQLAKAFHRPYVHDGDYSEVRERRFGAPAQDIPPRGFVVFCQDHDQVGNRAFGDRLPAAARPLAAFCVLLSPFTPMLFMGEEYGENAPFQFFSDHIDKRIADATRKGRRAEFAAFASFGHEVPDPQDVATFEVSKLSREVDPVLASLYAELLRARRELPREQQGEIAFDEDERWLRVQRGAFELVCNFSEDELSLRAGGVAGQRAGHPSSRGPLLRLGTHPEVTLRRGRLTLPPLSGALLMPRGPKA